MDADEALEGITRHARADIRKLFKDGKLIPVDLWPEEIADAVKAIKHTPFGPTIVMYDAAGAVAESIRSKAAFRWIPSECSRMVEAVFQFSDSSIDAGACSVVRTTEAQDRAGVMVGGRWLPRLELDRRLHGSR